MSGLVHCPGHPDCTALVTPGTVCSECRKAGGHPATGTHRTAGVAVGARQMGELG